MSFPVVFWYQQALDTFRREEQDPPLLKRMSELISLLDFTTTLNSPLSREDILDAALLIVMGELQAGKGGLFVRDPKGSFELRASRGVPRDVPTSGLLTLDDDQIVVASGEKGSVAVGLGLEVLCPVTKAGRTIAFLGLGARADRSPYGEAEAAFLRSVASCAATPIENGLMYQELRTVNRRLEVSVFQLRNLFEIARELTSSLDEETIKNLVTTTLMGHLLVSRCALYLGGPGGLSLAHGRGLEQAATLVPREESTLILTSLTAPCPVRDLPHGTLRESLLGSHLAFCFPLNLGNQAQGLVALGDRVSGVALTEEDLDFAMTLGRQALVALETVRLHEVRLQKQRQDRELQIAREIQQSLFPRSSPVVEGFEMAAVSIPCFQVGGDLYDLIPLGEGRTALAIADVSGKGTPASILMASLHASLRALSGTLEPTELITRVNRFLCESTQDNKFATLFYGELESRTRELVYVNAGHIPPILLRGGETKARLTDGGPVLGLLENAVYDVGRVVLGEGDIVAMVTDGATEALSADDEEFGDDRVADALRAGGRSAPELVRALVDAVHGWTGSPGCSDDLTALVLRAL